MLFAMPQKARKADLPNPQPQAGLIERKSTAIRFDNSWLVYDLLNKEILCTYQESYVHSQLYVRVFEPVKFKRCLDAEMFIDGELTIAHIQESLSTLKVMYSAALCL